jgi:hypothetical protein
MSIQRKVLLVVAALGLIGLSVQTSAQAQTRILDRNAENLSGDARAAVVRECNTEALRYTQHLWANLEVHQYRTCMARHGQAE